MNKYHLTFPFGGEYHFITVSANELANTILPPTDDYDEMEDAQKEQHIIYHDHKKFEVCFDFFNGKLLNVYDCIPYEEGGGNLVEGEIPWLCVKVEEDDKSIYDLGEHL